MDRIADLQLFLRVLDLGSISAAARSLDLSVAAASQRLKRLERALGVRLVHRTTRRLHVTPEGAALAEHGRSLVEDLEALTGSLRRSAKDVAGTLRVSIPASFGRLYVSPLLPAFLARHPRMKLHIDLSDQVRDLASEGFDLAIRIGTPGQAHLVARRLAGNRRVLCASPQYLAHKGVPTEPQDLQEHDCLLIVSGKEAQNVWHLRGPDEVETPVKVRGRLESNLGEVIRDAAVAGMGIALHSIWHVHEDLRSGRLRTVLPDYRLPDSGIYAVMPGRRLVLPRVRALVDFLARQFSGTPPWERVMKAGVKRSGIPR